MASLMILNSGKYGTKPNSLDLTGALLAGLHRGWMLLYSTMILTRTIFNKATYNTTCLPIHQYGENCLAHHKGYRPHVCVRGAGEILKIIRIRRQLISLILKRRSSRMMEMNQRIRSF